MTDADEPLDLLDPTTGERTGVTRPRRLVHRDGDWHGALHVWMFRRRPSPALYVQLRGGSKDTAPGYLDATVGGHYASGEGPRQALREVREELGVGVEFDDLVPLGKRIATFRGGDIVNYELDDVFLLPTELRPSDFTPDPSEVAGLYEIGLADVLRLFEEVDYACEVAGIRAGGEAAGDHLLVVDRHSFVPCADRYAYRVAVQIERLLEGGRRLAV